MTTSVVNIMPGVFSQGTLIATTQVVPMTHANLPCTVTIDTVDAGKKIEISTDGGVLYYTAPYTTSHANQLVAVITYPISHIKLTGAISDVWSIR
jgi:hypothetical protein